MTPPQDSKRSTETGTDLPFSPGRSPQTAETAEYLADAPLFGGRRHFQDPIEDWELD